MQPSTARAGPSFQLLNETTFPGDAIFVQNDAPDVKYGNASDWEIYQDPLCSGGSGHQSKSVGATATFKFTGAHIWFVSALGPTSGRLTASIGDRVATIDSRLVNWTYREVILDWELEQGTHELVLRNELPQWLFVDMFVYLPRPSEPPTVPASNFSTSTLSSTSSIATTANARPAEGLSRGAVAGAVVGGLLVLFVAVLLLVAWCYRQRRKRQINHIEEFPAEVPQFQDPYIVPSSSVATLSPSKGVVQQTSRFTQKQGSSIVNERPMTATTSNWSGSAASDDEGALRDLHGALRQAGMTVTSLLDMHRGPGVGSDAPERGTHSNSLPDYHTAVSSNFRPGF